MKALILSAGKGIRMGDQVITTPKVMLPLLGKPLLQHQIEHLKKFEVNEVCINTHYLPEKITGYFGDGNNFGVKIHYSYEPELLNTAGALHNFKKILNKTFILVYGDVFNLLNFDDMLRYHKKNKGIATLAIRKTDHPLDSDIVQIGKNNKIVHVVHKPGNLDYGDLGNVAIYILEPKIYNYLPESASDFIKDVFPRALQKGENLYGYMIQEYAKDIGTPQRFAEVTKMLQKMHFV